VFKKVLVANDGSDGGWQALSTAIDIAALSDAPIHMIAVEELSIAPVTIADVRREKMDADRALGPVIKQAKMRAHRAGATLHTHVVVGDPVRTISAFVEEGGFDLLVIGFKHHSALFERLVGGTSERLVERAPCSVLIIK
jgi:nucleotide-binding universal stress UspA family protein